MWVGFARVRFFRPWRDSFYFIPQPTVKTVGYYRSSLRDFRRPCSLCLNPVGSLTKFASIIRKNTPASSASFQPRPAKSHVTEC